jgi:hypothetical protein
MVLTVLMYPFKKGTDLNKKQVSNRIKICQNKLIN